MPRVNTANKVFSTGRCIKKSKMSIATHTYNNGKWMNQNPTVVPVRTDCNGVNMIIIVPGKPAIARPDRKTTLLYDEPFNKKVAANAISIPIPARFTKCGNDIIQIVFLDKLKKLYKDYFSTIV